MLTSDGVAVEAEHLPPRASGAGAAAEGSGHRPGPAAGPEPGPGEDSGPGHGPDQATGRAGRLAVVVAHGFTGALDRPAVRRAAGHLSAYAGVVTFSFRGHGHSGGHSTVGDLEVLDLDAAVRWARELGYERVATVGFSMGGSVVLRHAGEAGRAASAAGTPGTSPRPGGTRGVTAGVQAVVSVSSPARWYYRGTAPMRRVHWAITRPAGRLVSRLGLRTRIRAAEWDPVPLSPVESVPYIAPTPLLIVHGDQDAYFPLDHPYSLAAAAGQGNAELWIERGFGHAENAAGPVLLSRIGDWLTAHTAGIPGI
ncbi:alpha/beta fold hydrolase [Streptomyces sp. ITFR-21]|nr:alpha/beta fold hydrolase [Streptomyces sp. ITFR-21]WNI19712.1 alpha/beta fold hydrolase [Streptomyces sp. ITFR-21]